MSTGRWWESFDDPLLNEFIESIPRNNWQVQAARARIEKASASKDIAGSFLYPTIELNSLSGRRRSSEDILPILPPGIDREDGFFQMGLTTIWNFDIWKGVRHNRDAVRAYESASIESYHNLLSLLIADVTSTYIRIRTLQQQIANILNRLDINKEILNWLSHRQEKVEKLDLQQANLNVLIIESRLPGLERNLDQQIQRMAILLNKPSRELVLLLKSTAPIPFVGESVVNSLPAMLIESRPDVRQAEDFFQASVLKSKSAKTNLYPQLSFAGTFRNESIDADKLIDRENQSFLAGLSLRWKIFTGGRLKAMVDMENAGVRESYANYQESIFRAIEEVEHALYLLELSKEQWRKLIEVYEVTELAAQNAYKAYQEHKTDFQNLLDMSQLAASTEDQMIVAEGLIALGTIQLYLALGEGWESFEYHKNKSEWSF